MNEKGTLTTKIAEILNAAPKSFVSEDEEDTSAKVSGFIEYENDLEIEKGNSKFRKFNAGLLEDEDVKYKGKKVKRKDVFESEDEWFEDTDDNLNKSLENKSATKNYLSRSKKKDIEKDVNKIHHAISELKSYEMEQKEISEIEPKESSKVEQEEETSETEQEESEIEEEVDEKDQEDSQSKNFLSETEIEDSNESDTFEMISKSSINPIKKGSAVRNQLKIWENLIEMRIKFQKCLSGANSFPKEDKYIALLELKDFNEALKELKTKVLTLKEKLESLQKLLPKKDECTEAKNLPQIAKKRKAEKELGEEVYNDGEFYHFLLKDYIEFKSTDITDPIQLGKHWAQLQKLRSKMKKKIDTRCTKGRKIRYTIHSKLINFMPPIDFNIWTDEAKTELFNSLFGNRKPIILKNQKK